MRTASECLQYTIDYHFCFFCLCLSEKCRTTLPRMYHCLYFNDISNYKTPSPNYFGDQQLDNNLNEFTDCFTCLSKCTSWPAGPSTPHRSLTDHWSSMNFLLLQRLHNHPFPSETTWLQNFCSNIYGHEAGHLTHLFHYYRVLSMTCRVHELLSTFY